MEALSCPVCGASKIRIAIPDTRDHILGDKFDILACDSCHIHYTHPMPTHMDRYYPVQYRGYGPLVLSILRLFYSQRIKRWIRLFDAPGTALEIGCGSGIMLDLLRSNGWKVTGLERSDTAASDGRSRLGLNIITGEITKIKEEKVFDLIFLFNALEHLNDPKSMLQECQKRLKTNGLLIISVPNIESWQSRFGKGLWAHLDPPRHLFHFSRHSLEKMLLQMGMERKRISYVSIEHDPYGWVQSMLNKIPGLHHLFTRFVMGLEKFNMRVFCSIILGILLTIPAFCISAVSWPLGKGALMELTFQQKR